VAPPADPSPAFALGSDYLTLQPALGALLGDPVEDFSSDPSGCAAQQATSTGLVYNNCDTGLSAFVANDGLQHWGILNSRLLQWADSSADPPANAIDVAAAQASLPPPCGELVEPGVDTPCQLVDSSAQAGILSQPGESNAYEYNAVQLSNEVQVSLTQLPSDYDLYLADADGNILASSVLDGETPRWIDVTLDAGEYYIYVHVDEGRSPDPTTPYVLQAWVSQPPLDQSASAQPAP
jgi:hypothetical protein